MKKVSELDENIIQEIGQAFAYYNYGNEHGLIDAFPNRDAVKSFIVGYVRMSLKSEMLYTISDNNEAFIAYKLPKQKIPLKATLSLAKGFLRAMKLKDLIRFTRIMSKGGTGLSKHFDKAKEPYIYVGLVCVREQYQGQGYMRKVMNIAFKEGNRLGIPVILDTDAKSKCDKYVHLGMELVGTRHFGEHGVLYDLIKYPDSKERK